MKSEVIACSCQVYLHLPSFMWVFPKIGVPQNGRFIMENPIKMGWFGDTIIFGNTHVQNLLNLFAAEFVPVPPSNKNILTQAEIWCLQGLPCSCPPYIHRKYRWIPIIFKAPLQVIYSKPVKTGYSLQTLRDPGVIFGHLLHRLVKAPYDDHLRVVGMYENPSMDKLPTSKDVWIIRSIRYTVYCKPCSEKGFFVSGFFLVASRCNSTNRLIGG